MWRWVDRVGYWTATSWTPMWQVRTGVVLTIVSFLTLLYLPFSGEPPVIYVMSALALVLTGLGLIFTAVLALKEDDAASEEDLSPDT